VTSLRSLLMAFLGAFAAAVVLTGYVTYTASHRAIIALVDARIDLAADAVLSDGTRGDVRAFLARLAAVARRRDTGDIGFELEDARGRRLGGNVVLARPIADGFSTIARGDNIAGLSAGRAERRDAGGGLRLITIVETEPVDGFAAVRARNYLLGFGAILLIVAAGTATFASIVRRRIDELRTAAEAIIDGDMQRRVPVPARGGAFAAQAETFNRMLDRIAGLMDGIRHISSEVAHDLRTPLARLRGRLVLAAQEDAGAAARDELARAIEQCDDLLATFAAMMRIAEVEGGARRAGFARLDLAPLVAEVAETMRAVATDSGHVVRCDPVPSAHVVGDRALLAQALVNLVENALHHTPAGTTVTITVSVCGGQVTVHVNDDGPGIAPDDRACALRRFGRLDASRHCPGHGLGLPLVQAIAQLHGGSLTLGDAHPGLAAALILPRVPG
jgi:signal transduction histidine kinase